MRHTKGFATIALIIGVAIVVGIAGWIGYNNPRPTPSISEEELNKRILEAFNAQGIILGADNSLAVGGETYTLSGSGVSSSATSFTVTTFTIPGGDTLIRMTDFGDLGCGTIEPGNRTRQEFISFTGVTQNSDNTATLTGVTRGLSPITPYAASSTLQRAHAGGSQFVISNSPPCFYEGYLQRDNDESISGTWIFTGDPPIITGTATATNQVATRAYANSLAVQGAATTTTTASGIGVLASGSVAAAGTYTLEFPRLLGTNLSTSTYFGGYNNQIIVTRTNGSQDNTIDPNFIATSSSYTWGGTNIFSAAATTTFNATTTTVGLDATGFLTGNISRLILATTTDTVFGAVNNSTTTILTFNIPPNVLRTNTTDGVVKARLNLGQSALTRDTLVGFYIDFTYGGTTYLAFASTTLGANTNLDIDGGTIEFSIFGNGASSQEVFGTLEMPGFLNYGVTRYNYSTTTHASYSINSALQQTVTIRGWASSVQASLGIRILNAEVYLER